MGAVGCQGVPVGCLGAQVRGGSGAGPGSPSGLPTFLTASGNHSKKRRGTRRPGVAPLSDWGTGGQARGSRLRLASSPGTPQRGAPSKAWGLVRSHVPHPERGQPPNMSRQPPLGPRSFLFLQHPRGSPPLGWGALTLGTRCRSYVCLPIRFASPPATEPASQVRPRLIPAQQKNPGFNSECPGEAEGGILERSGGGGDQGPKAVLVTCSE